MERVCVKSNCLRSIYYNGIPNSGTNACFDFFDSYRKINEFMFFVLSMVAHINNITDLSRELQLIFASNKDDIKRLHEKWEKSGSVVDDFKQHKQVFFEIILARHVENYLVYVSTLLYEIFIQRPETLKSSEKIDIETVLSHTNLESLIHSLAEKKVNELSYKSFIDLNKYFFDKFRLSLVESEEMKYINDAIETRNLIVHNRTIINKRYLQKTGRTDLSTRCFRKLNNDEIENFVILMKNSVIRTDKEAITLLKLHTVEFKSKIDK